MALLFLVWSAFAFHRERGGALAAGQATWMLLRDAVADGRRGRGGLLAMLLSLAAVIGCAFLGVTRDLCDAIERGTDRDDADAPRGLRAYMVEALAELVERLTADRLMAVWPERVAAFEIAFREVALAGGEPWLDMAEEEKVRLFGDLEPGIYDEEDWGPLWLVLPPPAGEAPRSLGQLRPCPVEPAEDVRFKRRRRTGPPLVRLRPIERAA